MQEFYDLIHQFQPHALINFKTGVTGTEDILVGERELKSISIHYNGDTPQDQQIRKLADEAWEMNFEKKAEIAVTSQRSWEWNPKYQCQNVDELWNMLVHSAENNANLLLNFGPKPDGSIPEDVQPILHCWVTVSAEKVIPNLTRALISICANADQLLIKQNKKKRPDNPNPFLAYFVLFMVIVFCTHRLYKKVQILNHLKM